MFDQYTPRLSRLTAILTLLQSKRLVTARSIAEKFDISMRTAYRDIRALEEAGVPIITEEGKGYYLMEQYTIPPIMFTEDEVNALITAEQIIATNTDLSLIKNYSDAIVRIKAVLKQNSQNKGELLTQRIHIRNNPNREITSNYLTVIQQSIINNNLVAVAYKAESNEVTERQIEPLALYSTQGNWILIAYCQLRKEERAFRLDRIHSLQVLQEKFTPHNFTFEDYIERCMQKRNDP